MIGTGMESKSKILPSRALYVTCWDSKIFVQTLLMLFILSNVRATCPLSLLLCLLKYRSLSQWIASLCITIAQMIGTGKESKSKVLPSRAFTCNVLGLKNLGTNIVNAFHFVNVHAACPLLLVLCLLRYTSLSQWIASLCITIAQMIGTGKESKYQDYSPGRLYSNALGLFRLIQTLFLIIYLTAECLVGRSEWSLAITKLTACFT